MSRIRSTALVYFMVGLVAAAVAGACGRTPKRPCNIAVKCSNDEDVAWATDGNTCFVFRNNCHLFNENCHRQNSNATVLEVVKKEECQKLCRPFCTMDYRPVCAEYNGVERTFSNPCALSSHICLSGETYSLSHDGACDALATA